jgi:hypothetical protein
MGVEAGKAIRARQRETATRVDRLIAKRDGHGPSGSIRRERIQAATRDGRRALRARDAAQGAVHAAEVRVGAALARIAAEGLSSNEAFEVLGLSKSVGRRLVQTALDAPRRRDASSSTAPVSGRATSSSTGHGETGAITWVGASATGRS